MPLLSDLESRQIKYFGPPSLEKKDEKQFFCNTFNPNPKLRKNVEYNYFVCCVPEWKLSEKKKMLCSKQMVNSGFEGEKPLRSLAFVYFESHFVSFCPNLVMVQHTVALWQTAPQRSRRPTWGSYVLSPEVSSLYLCTVGLTSVTLVTELILLHLCSYDLN